jgi:hypothetical protein
MSTTPAGKKVTTRLGGRNLSLPLLVFALLFASNALAYLDPGTGSILLQGAIAAAAAIVTWLSLAWRGTKAWLSARLRFGERRDVHQ